MAMKRVGQIDSHAGKQRSMREGRQAEAGREAGKQGDRQAGRQAAA